MGFEDSEIDAIFQVLAGLVHLGDLSNCEKDEGDETATVQLDEQTIEKVHTKAQWQMISIYDIYIYSRNQFNV